jgi:HK97 family phage prohead protease
MSRLYGHLAVFNEWTEINSPVEGHFMEVIAPGAFTRTLRENGESVRLLLEHGHDPGLGDRPIARPTVLREDDKGLYYEGELFPGVPEVVVEGIKAGQYGASFRFRPRDEIFEDRPTPGPHNPRRLPQRVLLDVDLVEGGPVTFGQYRGASSGVRSEPRSLAVRTRAAGDSERQQLREFVEELVKRDRGSAWRL